jgi:flotillin
MDEAGKLQMVIEKLPRLRAPSRNPCPNRQYHDHRRRRRQRRRHRGGSGYAVGALKAVNEAMKETIGFDLTEVMKANTYDAKTMRSIQLDVKGLQDGLSGVSNPKA